VLRRATPKKIGLLFGSRENVKAKPNRHTRALVLQNRITQIQALFSCFVIMQNGVHFK
jgi:hypothetical protein